MQLTNDYRAGWGDDEGQWETDVFLTPGPLCVLAGFSHVLAHSQLASFHIISSRPWLMRIMQLYFGYFIHE